MSTKRAVSTSQFCEGFVFCMLGAGFLTNSFNNANNNDIDQNMEYAKNAKNWGKLGLNLSLKYNNKNDKFIKR